jgi:NADH-quinone oxidoreductase subunit K
MQDTIHIEHFLTIGAILFSIGIAIVLVKKNIIAILMGIELMFNAANINLVALSQYDAAQIEGQILTLFIVIIAAAEAAIALAIIVKVVRSYQTTDIDELNKLKG